jgi:hypothetical protein
MAGVLGGLKAACAAGGWFGNTHENGSRYSGFDVNLLPAKIGLDNGVHFRTRPNSLIAAAASQ